MLCLLNSINFFIGRDTDSLDSDFDDIDEETVEFFIREETEIIQTKDDE